MAKFAAPLFLLLALHPAAAMRKKADATENVENTQDQEEATVLKGLLEESATDMIQPYSEAMLEKAHSLVNKHAPQVTSALGKKELEPLLKGSSDLRQMVNEIEPSQNEGYMMSSLFKRARTSLPEPAVALLDKTTGDKTPCVLMLEEYNDIDIVDLDEKEEFHSKDACNRECLSRCAAAGSRYNIDANELMILGISPYAPGINGNQVGAVCEQDGDCKCLDATQSIPKVDGINRQLFGHNYRNYLQPSTFSAEVYGRYLDVSEIPSWIPMPLSERQCMETCPTKLKHKGAEWRGLCFDEAY